MYYFSSNESPFLLGVVTDLSEDLTGTSTCHLYKKNLLEANYEFNITHSLLRRNWAAAVIRVRHEESGLPP